MSMKIIIYFRFNVDFGACDFFGINVRFLSSKSLCRFDLAEYFVDVDEYPHVCVECDVNSSDLAFLMPGELFYGTLFVQVRTPTFPIYSYEMTSHHMTNTIYIT